MLSHLNAPLKLCNFIKKRMLATMTGHFLYQFCGMLSRKHSVNSIVPNQDKMCMGLIQQCCAWIASCDRRTRASVFSLSKCKLTGKRKGDYFSDFAKIRQIHNFKYKRVMIFQNNFSLGIIAKFRKI